MSKKLERQRRRLKRWKYALRFVDERVADEDRRGTVFENKAGTLLGFLGVVVGLIIPVTVRLYVSGKEIPSVPSIMFIAFILFLLRGVWYAFRVVAISKVYRLSPDAVDEFSRRGLVEITRREVRSKRWLLKYTIGNNTKKAFYLQRAHRNAALSIFIYVLFGALVLTLNRIDFLQQDLSYCGLAVSIAAIIMLLFILDPVVEKIQKIFH